MDVKLTDARRVEKLSEDYIYEWSILEFITNFLAIMFSSYVGGLLVIFFISLQFNINLYQYFSFLINYIVPIIFIIIMKLRKRIINHLINRANRNENLGSLYKHQKLMFFMELLLFAYLLVIISLNKIGIITNGGLLLMASIISLYTPIYFTFGTILTEVGLVFIEFNELNRNIRDFKKRQNWLTKICKRVSDIFKEGNIMINKDELRSQFNLQMRNSVNMTSKINEMKNWFLSEDKNDDLFTIFEKVWPDVKKDTYVRKRWYEYTKLLPPYQYVVLIIGIILAIILMIQDPSLFNDIIRQLMDKLL